MKGLGGDLENVKSQFALPRWEFNIFKSPPQGYVSRLNKDCDRLSQFQRGGKVENVRF
jgi:hypothetical protein